MVLFPFRVITSLQVNLGTSRTRANAGKFYLAPASHREIENLAERARSGILEDEFSVFFHSIHSQTRSTALEHCDGQVRRLLATAPTGAHFVRVKFTFFLMYTPDKRKRLTCILYPVAASRLTHLCILPFSQVFRELDPGEMFGEMSFLQSVLLDCGRQ